MVRKTLLAAMLLIALPAFAGDFSGGYFGAYAGSSSGDDVVNSDESGDTTTVSPSGTAYGLLIGFNHQEGDFVIGTELELGLGSADDFLDEAATNNLITYDITSNNSVDYRLSAHFGYAMDSFMPYVIADIASMTSSIAAGCGTCTPVTEGYDLHRIGFGVGLGLAWQMGDSWSFRGEYITEDYASATFNSYNLTADSWDLKLSLDTFRIVASMKF